ncbi:hypothetical protein JMN32_12495 [Fulvivirga sp. 29W222]|uniref:histidine kinase n=1 Tax=Fulvivirga marina TaxID=2494733 RepID=A0A937FY52_9BACT|nr:hypothetical protein [Fulvivirga marina]
MTIYALGQNNGNYFIHNYNRSDYQASISNFDIIQGHDGMMYAANFDGVLIYNGSWWEFNAIPSNAIASCIAKDLNNRIYVGSKEDFGFLKPLKNGQLSFTSLLKESNHQSSFSSIRKIIPFNKRIYFLSPEVIFVLNEDGTIETIESDGYPFQFSLYKNQGNLYSIQKDKGLISIDKNNNTSILGTDISNIGILTFMSNGGNDSTIIGSFKNGLFFSKNGSNYTPIQNNLSKYLAENILFTGIEVNTPDSTKLLLGTFKNGIVETNSNLKNFTVINKASGLQSDFIKTLYIDNDYNLWSAMQEGISKIEFLSPWKYWNNKDGIEGTPWDIYRLGDTLYIGTTKGLFYLKENRFNKVPGIGNKVWSLSSISKSASSTTLIVATETGLYEVDQGKANLIEELPAINKLFKPYGHEKELYVGLWAGISKLSYNNDRYTVHPLMNTSNNTVTSMLMDDYNLWASSKFTGVYKIPLNSNTPIIDLLNKENELPDVNKINIIKHAGDILFTTDHGIYKHINSNGNIKFVRDSSLIKSPVNIGKISKAANGDYYASVIQDDRTEHIERFYKVGDEYLRETTPFKRLPEMEILAIYPEKNGVVWIAGSEGLFRYDSKVKKDYTIPFNTIIRKAAIRDSVIFHGFYPVKVDGSDIPGIGIIQPEDMQPILTYDDNSITFEYSATSYEVPEKNQFSYYLENNDRGWSNWSTETKKEYNNLDPGEYIFFVKSKNIYGTEGRLATYKFKVLAPWYQTAWAYVLWSALAGFVVWFITIAYSVRVRTQRKKLQLIVADRTYEVMTQKREIEQQNHLLMTKNEEISLQKDDIQKKNIQLKDSQEEILNMNQKLTELNMYLEKKVEKRTSKIKATLKKLQQINGELDTFVYRASHDLKGPISRINGITSLAKLESPDDINRKYFDMIEHTAKDMGVLLSKLAQVHEIINSKPHKEEIDIPSLLSEIRDLIKFHDKGFHTKYSFDLKVINITSDRYLLGIIIKNIIENALIFRKTESDDPHHIHISTSIKDGIFEIKIKDNGIGIHSPHLNMIFQMFFRGSDKSKGSGLGLYLVKMCVDKLKASIEVASQENEFTEFTISIPV